MELIRTSYRARLPRGLSYPVGAQALSQALAGVPQFESLELSFHLHPQLFASQFRENLLAGGPLTIFTASYCHMIPGLSASHLMLESGFYDENWELIVFSVPSEKRYAIRERLLTVGLPRVRSWLAEPRSQVWRTGRKHVSLQFDPVEESIHVSESEAA